MALFFRKIFLVAFLPLLLAACGGDWTAGSPDADGALFNRSFRYYYVMDCRYDSFGLYDCSYEEPVSPAYTASLRIDSDGFASLNLDGRNNFYYTERQYGSGHDDDGSYYYFYEDDYELSLYKNGSQLIFWDTRENTATVYLYDLEY
ncbi:hypothetical protein SAMN05720761_11335 [Fibrobacter sp. UWCM]|jgi:hypothetical protein|uniref:hypothetical protein n=1 Tax=Fibrobacter sp. UWCM TaxID=1896208 RepID=UPI0009187112|nr:hypothetical protein [Fibrobacter sp. UWCM]SHH35685.1 hypothetical protein SAMN05720761_11335 [Fibrobacter sp. UWCM]